MTNRKAYQSQLRAVLGRARRRLGGVDVLRRNDSPPASGAPAKACSDAQMFPEERWFADHIHAAREVISFLDANESSLAGRRVADVGTGDGIIALGLAVEGRPAELVAFDLNATDTNHLLALARSNQYAERLPSNLRFEESRSDRIPADDGTFDAVVSWSCFEHVSNPPTMAKELRRIVSDSGVLFLQLWPFYYSEHGSHLFDWYAGGFPHLVFAEEEIRSRVLVENPQPHSDYIWSEYQTLNRITLDDLGAALFAAGFRVAQAELISNLTSLPEAVASQPLSRLLISGVKLMAYPR